MSERTQEWIEKYTHTHTRAYVQRQITFPLCSCSFLGPVFVRVNAHCWYDICKCWKVCMAWLLRCSVGFFEKRCADFFFFFINCVGERLRVKLKAVVDAVISCTTVGNTTSRSQENVVGGIGRVRRERFGRQRTWRPLPSSCSGKKITNRSEFKFHGLLLEAGCVFTLYSFTRNIFTRSFTVQNGRR